MQNRKIEIERVSVTSSKPFEAVVAALEAAVGHPDAATLQRISEGAGSFAELKEEVDHAVGATGLMLFTKLDLGAIVRKESGRDKPKIVRLLVGNPLIMKDMAKHTPDAASYAPVTIMVDERPDGVHLAYDKMASFLAPYGNPVARDLDAKIEGLLHEAAVA